MFINSENIKKQYDLIVIGSGPAGISLVQKYLQLAPMHKVLLIESGKINNSDNKAQELAKNIAHGSLKSNHYELHNQRVLGGTSTVWNGFCAVLEERAFLNNEWPISYKELYKNYPEACSILEIPSNAYKNPEKILPGSDNLIYKPYYFSRPIRFNNKDVKNWLAKYKNIDVLLNHSLKKININNSTAKTIVIKESSDSKKESITININKLTLCAGGIQNAKILQASISDSPMPIGKYFQEHPHIYGAIELSLDEEKFNKIKDKSTKRIRHAVALSSKYTNENNILSATFDINEKKLTRKKINILGANKNIITVKTTIRMEMTANPNNKVSTASMKFDHLGNGITNVNFLFNEQEIKHAVSAFSTELTKSGLGRIQILPGSFKVHGGGHMIGTTRMGSSIKNSVTDKNCKVHNIDNLFIAGSSLYPAGAAANPTLTIVCLALRLAQHLVKV